MKTRISSNFKMCATCSHWCGQAISDFSCTIVEYDTNERGRCAGGAFNGATMNAIASCNKWSQRFKR